MITETLEVFRGDTDRHGNAGKTPSHTVEGVFSWGTGKTSARFGGSNDRQESATLTVELYVSRTADLKQRDRIKRANGDWYSVVGFALWDQPHPQTGHDFGMNVYQVTTTQ